MAEDKLNRTSKKLQEKEKAESNMRLERDQLLMQLAEKNEEL